MIHTDSKDLESLRKIHKDFERFRKSHKDS